MSVNTDWHKIKSYMFDNRYNEWDFLPKFLSPDEVKNPLTVLDDFFSSDWLPGHLDALKLWRKYILENAYFTDPKGNPSSLLHSYKCNVRLIEACHLLLLFHKENLFEVDASSLAQLENEKDIWLDFPMHLSSEELLKPLPVIESFFETFNLPQYREQLEYWLEFGLSSRAAGEFLDAADIISVYESMQMLYGVAWLVHQRTTDKPYLKAINVPNKLRDDFNKVIPAPQLYNLNRAIDVEQKEEIGKIVEVVKNKIPSVQAIFYLGVPSVQPAPIFIFLLTEDNESRLAQSLNSMVEESLLPVAKVYAITHHSTKMLTAGKDGDVFFNYVLNSQLIFLSGSLLLPKPMTELLLRSNSLSNQKWERWHKQGKEFLSGADYYLKNDAYGPALFSMHQCAECILIAIIRAVLGYRTNAHNLSRLFGLTRMFTNDIHKLFDLDNEEGLKLFNILKDAYINVRYKDTFEPDTKKVAILYPVIQELVILSEAIYTNHLAQSTL